MDSMRHYLGIDFEVWEAQQRWLWCVIDPHRDGGAIGAAASENDAVRDACLCIDEMMSARAEVCISVDWEISLSNLERYLARCCDRIA
ncbi:MAG TPA: hypothetical protein VKV03_07245 [Candidatus Binataceae bacterium]|nr:hypothetical protein [Candidatus Binataceae bacterium]